MAFSAIPTAFLGAGYVADATTLTVLLANVSQITSVEADEATGDSRKIIYGLLDKWNTVYAALEAADRPARMTMSKSTGSVGASNQFNVTFTINFTVAAATVDVAAE